MMLFNNTYNDTERNNSKDNIVYMKIHTNRKILISDNTMGNVANKQLFCYNASTYLWIWYISISFDRDIENNKNITITNHTHDKDLKKVPTNNDKHYKKYHNQNQNLLRCC